MRGRLDSLALARDGQWLAAAVDESTSVRVWSALDGQWLADLSGHEQRVVAVAASPTANLLASSGRNPKIRLWDMDQRKVIATLKRTRQRGWRRWLFRPMANGWPVPARMRPFAFGKWPLIARPMS